MHILTVYEGGTISLQFTGKSKDAILDALRCWMNIYNGEGDHPQRVDGLTCRDCPAPHDVILRWDEDYGKWCIWWDDETPRYFGWTRAAAAFVDACACKAVRVDDPCPMRSTETTNECPSCKRIAELINWWDDGLEWWGCQDCFDEYGDGTKGKEIPPKKSCLLDDPCQDCIRDCRVSFPACEASDARL